MLTRFISIFSSTFIFTLEGNSFAFEEHQRTELQKQDISMKLGALFYIGCASQH